MIKKDSCTYQNPVYVSQQNQVPNFSSMFNYYPNYLPQQLSTGHSMNFFNSEGIRDNGAADYYKMHSSINMNIMNMNMNINFNMSNNENERANTGYFPYGHYSGTNGSFPMYYIGYGGGVGLMNPGFFN
jgi:hypothetical protein